MNLPVWFLAVCVSISVACGPANTIKENKLETEPAIRQTLASTEPDIPIHIASFSSTQLCERLISVDTIPTFEPTPTDPIYESLIAKGKDAIPCLAEKISDTTPMPDPRYSVPSWRHYAVGDTAVFILLRILSQDDDSKWEELMTANLPQKYREEWKTNGIYAYFNYVSEAKNRKELQNRWKKWLQDNPQ